MRRFWPRWLPIPSRPWRLEDEEGRFLRDDKGRALEFKTGQAAIDHVKKAGLRMVEPMADLRRRR